MRILFLLILLGGAYKAYSYWQQYTQEQQRLSLAAQSPNGFVPVLRMAQQDPKHVFVLAPANCPSEHAQRAEYLLRELNRRGIPATRISSVQLVADQANEETRRLAEYTQSTLSSGAPPVLINGMGKASPSLEEVIDEYRRLNGH